eukprot:SAG31_NODE_13326_length_876_cov_1.655084_2_plen_101_part_00
MARLPERGHAWPPKFPPEEVPVGSGGPLAEVPAVALEHFGFKKYVPLFIDAGLNREACYQLGSGDTRVKRKDGTERQDFGGWVPSVRRVTTISGGMMSGI